MRFIRVDGTGELIFPANRLGEDDDLFEQKHRHLLQLVVWTAGGIVGAEQRSMEQQFALSYNFPLEPLETADVHHVIRLIGNDRHHMKSRLYRCCFIRHSCPLTVLQYCLNQQLSAGWFLLEGFYLEQHMVLGKPLDGLDKKVI